MVIWESSITDAAELRQLAASCAEETEIFLRDDQNGALMVCSGTKSADGSPYREVKKLFDSGRFAKAGGDWLFCVGLWTPNEFREEFLAWYQMEHLPILLECSEWNGCRFVEEVVQIGCQFYAMHQLSDRNALDSEERKRSRSTPWFKRLTSNDWFDGAFKRTLYKRIS